MTIRKIGSPRRRVWAILFTEILMVISGAVLIAAGLILAATQLGGVFIQVMSG